MQLRGKCGIAMAQVFAIRHISLYKYILKALLMNKWICCLGIIHERQSKTWQSCTKRVKNIEKMH